MFILSPPSHRLFLMRTPLRAFTQRNPHSQPHEYSQAWLKTMAKSSFASLLLLLLCLVPHHAAVAQEQKAKSSRPNVLVFLADDLGWGDVGYHQGEIDTPTIDRLAREGMRLNRFYAAPICSPTRAALMTGRDPIRLGVAYATILPWLNHGIHGSERFISESFKEAGYRTAMFGKWHLGHAQQQFLPNSRGFDHFYGHLHTEVGYYPPFASIGGTDFQRNGKTVNDQGYETYLLAREAMHWLKNRDKNSEQPFFVYVPFLAPHTPLSAPKDLLEKYKDLKDTRVPSRSASDRSSRFSKLTGRKSIRPIYAAVVEAMDKAMGDIIDTLEKEDLLDNTIILFLSDNGGQVVHGVGGASNAPLRGGKGETFEGGIRVPAVIRWAGKIPAASVLQEMMTVMDVFPTLASMAAVPTGATRRLDGLDMSPAILNQQKVKRTKPVIFASETPIKNNIDYAVFDGDWKLMQEVDRLQYEVVVVNRLYNIIKDPYEYNNLAEANPDVVNRLTRELYHWRALYPINGIRSELVPPPGWHAPKDWATYAIPSSELQAELGRGMAPASVMRPLDYILGERGRLIYDCDPYRFVGGGLCR